ncbi:MAG: nitronate monooxygenase [Promethearchaeota archaeon]|nr:MAG: nitronate monooxygenase [Candidatus Lokiarchaeota archaeon]
MIFTKFQEIIGTKYPIIQAGMGPYSTTDLCIAVAKEGGLGLISTIGMGAGLSPATPEAAERVFGKGRPQDILKRTIQYVFDNLKDYPDAKFGVNIPVATDFSYVAKRLMRGTIEILKEKPEIHDKFAVIVTSAGDPLPWSIDAVSKGAKKAKIPIKEELPKIVWSHVCPNVRAAKRCEKAGVDIVIASGREGGAHCAWRDVSSLVLLPEVVNNVTTPVVGAGGFSDGASLAAALALGAIGIQMGTRFIATKEADFQQMWKEAIVKRAETDTLVARGLFGPMRFLRNKMSLKVVDETISDASDLFRGIPCPSNQKIMDTEMEGLRKLYEENEEESIILGGVVTGRIHSIPTVKELLENIIAEAEEIISKLPSNIRKEKLIEI